MPIFQVGDKKAFLGRVEHNRRDMYSYRYRLHLVDDNYPKPPKPPYASDEEILTINNNSPIFLEHHWSASVLDMCKAFPPINDQLGPQPDTFGALTLEHEERCETPLTHFLETTCHGDYVALVYNYKSEYTFIYNVSKSIDTELQARYCRSFQNDYSVQISNDSKHWYRSSDHVLTAKETSRRNFYRTPYDEFMMSLSMTRLSLKLALYTSPNSPFYGTGGFSINQNSSGATLGDEFSPWKSYIFGVAKVIEPRVDRALEQASRDYMVHLHSLSQPNYSRATYYNPHTPPSTVEIVINAFGEAQIDPLLKFTATVNETKTIMNDHVILAIIRNDGRVESVYDLTTSTPHVFQLEQLKKSLNPNEPNQPKYFNLRQRIEDIGKQHIREVINSGGGVQQNPYV